MLRVFEINGQLLEEHLLQQYKSIKYFKTAYKCIYNASYTKDSGDNSASEKYKSQPVDVNLF